MIRLDQDDVTVEENVYECENCTGTITGPSYRVMVDFRSAGMGSPVVEMACEKCAEEIAARIRESLPAPATEVYGCCGCSCHVCAKGHASGRHTQACHDRVFGPAPGGGHE